MTVSNPNELRQARARLRKLGVIILLAGLTSAGLLFWIRHEPEDPNTSGYFYSRTRAESRQMGVVYGKSGRAMEDLLADLQKPGVHAGIIAFVSITVALGCFYFGQEPEENSAKGADPSTN